MKKQNGITLIALVITVVILIILSTVTLNVVIGENGLIERTQYAKDLYVNSAVAEEQEINDLIAQMDNIDKEQIYKEEIEKYRTAKINLNNAISLIETASEVASEEAEMAQRIRTITVQMANGTNTEDDMKAMAEEINGWLSGMEMAATETVWNGMNITDGSLAGENAYKVDIITRELILEIESMTRGNLGLDQIGDLTTKEDATNLQKMIDEAINKLSSIIGLLGAKQTLYEQLIDYYNQLEEVLLQGLLEDETKDKMAIIGMQKIISMLERVKKLENQASNVTMTESDKASFLIEINETIDGINIIAEDTEFKGQKLLDGSYKDIPNLNSIGLSQDGSKFYVDLSTTETINQSITECENAITKIEEIINNLEK